MAAATTLPCWSCDSQVLPDSPSGQFSNEFKTALPFWRKILLDKAPDTKKRLVEWRGLFYSDDWRYKNGSIPVHRKLTYRWMPEACLMCSCEAAPVINEQQRKPAWTKEGRKQPEPNSPRPEWVLVSVFINKLSNARNVNILFYSAGEKLNHSTLWLLFHLHNVHTFLEYLVRSL